METTTNYFNTFIEIAEDCPVSSSEIPPLKGEKRTIANLQFQILSENPYQYTSDDILFAVYAIRKNIPDHEIDEERMLFFSKGQPCFRSSPLTKRYGWGIHSNEKGKIAMVALESKEYKDLLRNESISKTRAMRSKRAKKVG